jgi:type VI secretion system protein ImpB
VELEFNKLADFSPEAVVKQIEPLNDLLEIRNKLKDLLSRTEGNDRLEEMLNSIIENPEVREKLGGALGVGGDAGGDAPAADAGDDSGETPEAE